MLTKIERFKITIIIIPYAILGNHYVRLGGVGNVTIVSSLETSCSRIKDDAKFGFLYKMSENTSVSTLDFGMDKQYYILYNTQIT